MKEINTTLTFSIAGLKAGDVVTLVNKNKSAQLSEEYWIALSSQPAQLDVCTHNLQCINFNTEHIKGYSNK